MQDNPEIVRGKDMKNVFGVAESTAWVWAKDPGNSFPAPRKFGDNFSGWLYSELMEWAKSSQPVYLKEKK